MAIQQDAKKDDEKRMYVPADGFATRSEGTRFIYAVCHYCFVELCHTCYVDMFPLPHRLSSKLKISQAPRTSSVVLANDDMAYFKYSIGDANASNLFYSLINF